MNISLINQSIINISNNFYYDPNQINISESIKEVAKSVPSNIIDIFILAIIFFVAYYYFIPVYERYFRYSNEMAHMFFIGGLSLTIFGVVNLIYYIFPDMIKHYLILGACIIVGVLTIYWVSIWLLNRKRQK